MVIKLIAMDMDGTLLNAQGEISERNAQALRACEARGIVTAISSGRGFENARRYAVQAGLHSAILSANGARIDLSPDGPLAAENTMDVALAKKTLRIFRNSGAYFVAYTRGKNYVGNPTAYAPPGHARTSMVEDLDGYPHEIIIDAARLEAEGTCGTYKFVAFGLTPPAVDALKAELVPLDLEITQSWRDNVEVMRRGVHKGLAVQMLAERENIRREEIMAFGDNDNDIAMLRAAGWPVAMENAIERVKREARIIAPHHDQSGVGQVLERYVLSEGDA